MTEEKGEGMKMGEPLVDDLLRALKKYNQERDCVIVLFQDGSGYVTPNELFSDERLLEFDSIPEATWKLES